VILPNGSGSDKTIKTFSDDIPQSDIPQSAINTVNY